MAVTMNDHLNTYLNDHLAGSVAGIEIAKHLEETAVEQDVRAVLTRIRADIEADQVELSALAERLGVEQSGLRKAAAWMGEKAAELKLRFDDPSGGEFRTYEALEALSIGIEGKRCLWLSLQSISSDNPIIRKTDLKEMQRRAELQRASVEELRLKIAKLAFTTE